MADHPPRTCKKTGEGGRALAVAPNGRPAGCSPCSTAKSHSLGSINNRQHSSNEEREKRTEGREQGENEKNRGERGEEIERRREKEERRTKKQRRVTGREEGPTRKQKKPRKRREREERRERTKPSETAAAPPGVAVREQVAATSFRHSTARNAGSHRHPAPGNSSPSPVLLFLYFLLCMQNE
jgi:hypothetical protein